MSAAIDLLSEARRLGLVLEPDGVRLLRSEERSWIDNAEDRGPPRTDPPKSPVVHSGPRSRPLFLQSDDDLLAELPPDDRAEVEREPEVLAAYLASRRARSS